MPLQRQYAYFRYSQDTGFPYDLKEEKNMCGGGGEIRNATFVRLENEVQEHASQFDTSSVMCQALPALIMGLFIGPWTDSGGRKLALMVPVLGSILESLLTICVMHFSWPLYVIYAGNALNGLTGFFSALFQVSMSYIADISDPSQIAFRLVPLISALSGPLLPSVKGMMSKMVPTEEQGSLFTGVSAVETLARIFGAAVVNAIYVRSIDVGMPGIAFWACAVALLIPVALISYFNPNMGNIRFSVGQRWIPFETLKALRCSK
ncbi:predicted protein [Nematostella vectensis]|uniref:Solute carrier family 46 member 3 n=1 Tax=Nematostella vectensis TaxID=45351 RepID=A7RIK2_NEMVE|nr:predicted protein [Nematostella vectensis]|eukprot:XP_001640883.1 predicted protein [Nematostella vectensis]